MNPYAIIKRPMITEKTTRHREKANAYAFEVDPKANALEIKQAIEKIFKVKVMRVNTTTIPGKSRRFGRWLSKSQRWKKAVATLKAGDRIELYEGV